MFKYVVVLCIAVALMHETQAFKVISIHAGAPAGSSGSSAPASSAPAVDPNALIQNVQSAIAGKLQQVQSLVGSLVQQKVALTQNALNSIQSTLGSFKSQANNVAARVRPPFVIRKSIYVGAPPAKPAAAPETTASTAVDATTSSSSGY